MAVPDFQSFFKPLLDVAADGKEHAMKEARELIAKRRNASWVSTSPIVLHQKFGVQLSQSQFKSTKEKWADRTKKAFEDAGKVWNKSVKMQVKRTAVDACISCGIASLIPHRSKPIDNLILSLETKMAVCKI